MKKWCMGALVIVMLLGGVSPARAENTWSNFGMGVGAVLSSCLYSPAKLIYATVGAVTGGLAYVLTVGNTEIACNIWDPSVRGTYIITPNMLKGKEEVQFVGRREQGAGSTEQ
jgi:hypothetical protein